jgi:ubiquinone/menaquinone biosynthesis C-methylase UbiE
VAGETPQAAFWNGMARRYADSPVRNPENWEKTLELTRARLAPEAEVLELGCGTGSSALRLAPHLARYTGTDDASGMIGIAREKLAETPVEGLSFETARTGDGSLPEGPFDAVLAFNLLHLVPDLPATLAEARDPC